MSTVQKTSVKGPKGAKGKGGKPMAGVAAADAASIATAAALAEYSAEPAAYTLFTLVEDMGIPKKGQTDYLLKVVRSDGKGVAVEAIVPRTLLSKSGKLALPSMGAAGTQLLIKTKTVVRQRMGLCSLGGVGRGIEAMRAVSEMDYIVYAAL